jgi:RsiW-degrading membrane proteinase PrsW (M82 family)
MWALGASLLAVMRHVTEIVDLTPVAFFVVMATIGAYGGLIYLLVIRIGIKQRKHGVVLGTAIAFTVISAVSLLVWGVPIEPIDWALQVLGAIQIVLTLMVYAKLKPESSLTHAN